MDSPSVVKIGLLGGAAYLVYRYFVAPAPSVPAGSPAPNTSTAVAPGIPPKSLDAIYAQMVIEAAKEGVGADGAGLDAWNVYATRAGGPAVEPAPEDVFGAMSQEDRTRKYTASEYWGKMAPYLKSRGGFAGLGLFGYLATGRAY